MELLKLCFIEGDEESRDILDWCDANISEGDRYMLGLVSDQNDPGFWECNVVGDEDVPRLYFGYDGGYITGMEDIIDAIARNFNNEEV